MPNANVVRSQHGQVQIRLRAGHVNGHYVFVPVAQRPRPPAEIHIPIVEWRRFDTVNHDDVGVEFRHPFYLVEIRLKSLLIEEVVLDPLVAEQPSQERNPVLHGKHVVVGKNKDVNVELVGTPGNLFDRLRRC